MNYKEINQAIIEGRDVDETLVVKNKQFYKYLLNNKVAYYYCTTLSQSKNSTEFQIIDIGRKYNDQYALSLRILTESLEKIKLNFAVFKTRRLFNEVVDGDIDVMIPPGSLQKFFVAMRKHGFECIEDEPGKGKCTKRGFSTIEPHENISWRSIRFAKSPNIISTSKVVSYKGVRFHNASDFYELLAAAYEYFYSPEYIDLYHVITLNGYNDVTVPKSVDHTDARVLKRYVDTANRIIDNSNRKLPYFPKAYELIKVCARTSNLIESTEVLFKSKAWSYRYKLTDKLPFTHDWNL